MFSTPAVQEYLFLKACNVFFVVVRLVVQLRNKNSRIQIWSSVDERVGEILIK